MDLAAAYVSSANQYPPMSHGMERRIVKKLDWILIPMLLLTATLGAVDKVAIGTAAIYGLREDLHLSGEQYSWVGSILYVGCVAGMAPSSYLLQRVSASRYLCTCSMLWSLTALLIPTCRNWSSLMGLRFIMGCLEAIIVPSISLVIAGFYKKSEQPPRNAIAFAAASSIINGFLSWIVGHIPSSAPLKIWQYLFLITGSLSFSWSMLAFWILPDTPMNAWFLTEEEKYHAVTRLASNKTGIASRVWKWDQALEAVADIKTWIIFLFNISINVPNGGLITFSGIIINNLGFTPVQTSLLNMPTGVMSTLSSFIFSYIAAKWANHRCLVTIIASCVPMFGSVLVYAFPKSNIGGQMLGIYLLYTYFGPYVLGISLGQANTAGYTKKNVQYSILYVGYAAGNLIGPQTFRESQAPEYTGGFVAMLVCYCLCIGLMGLYWLVAIFLNDHRHRHHQLDSSSFPSSPATAMDTMTESDIDSLIDSFADLTDFQQRNFKYTT